jgi:hypothetical protein
MGIKEDKQAGFIPGISDIWLIEKLMLNYGYTASPP